MAAELDERQGSRMNDRADGGPTAFGVQLARPLPDEAQVELGFQVAVEVARGNQLLQRDGDGLIEAAGLCGAEHGTPPRQHGGRESSVLVRLSFIGDVTI